MQNLRNLRSVGASAFSAMAFVFLACVAFPRVSVADTILHDFTAGSDGSVPHGSLTLVGSTLYGLTTFGASENGGILFEENVNGTGYSILHDFGGGSDGVVAQGSLTLSGSTLYGWTTGGGSSGYGTLFSINTDGTNYSVIYSFTGGASNGLRPGFGGPAISGTTIYGTTTQGGSAGNGTLYSINNSSGSGFSLLHSFTGSPGDGSDPVGKLVLSGSTLFGITETGGSQGGGIIYSINTSGTGFNILHSFGAISDAHMPFGSLTLVGSTLYGMTYYGGSQGDGAIFSINEDGTGYTIVHSFGGGANDGVDPTGSLTLIGSKLYGMTTYGGANGDGIIFSMNPDGTGFSVISSFAGGTQDGENPYSDVVGSADGQTLYGMTPSGGTDNSGVVFSQLVPAPEPGATIALAVGAMVLLTRRNRGASRGPR